MSDKYNEEFSPYDLGYSHGYHDEIAECPYPEGSDEEKEYYEGYDEGSRNS